MFTITINSNSTDDEFKKLIDILQILRSTGSPVVTQGMTSNTPPVVDSLPPVPAPVAAPVPAPIAAPGTVTELDSSGMPWDARIHSSSKAKKGDGTWKVRRGLDDKEYEAVRAELITSMGKVPEPVIHFGSTQPVVGHVPPPPGAPVVGHVPPPPTQVPLQQTVIPQPGVVNPAPQPGVVNPVVTWPVLLSRLTAAKTNKGLTDDTIKQFLDMHSIETLALLARRPDLFVSFLEHCGA